MVAAILVREPFNLTLAEIGELTDWQIRNIYFRPGKPGAAKKGVYSPVGNVGMPDAEDDDEETLTVDGEAREVVSFRETAYSVYRLRERIYDPVELARRFKADYPGYNDDPVSEDDDAAA